MIKLERLTKNLPEGDYVIEKEAALRSIAANLTPKFESKWKIIIIDPSIVFTLELIDDTTFPEWIDVTICTNLKKIDRITEVKPSMIPKEETAREAFKTAVSTLSHMISPKASKYLFESLRGNKELLIATLHKLDSECKSNTIELKDVQAEVIKPNIVWASRVVDSFLLGEKQRWDLMSKLIGDIGQTVAYYAIKKYVNRLLKEKNDYLHNEDVKLRIMDKIPATDICLLYSLAATATNPAQLTAIFTQFEERKNFNIEED